MDKRKTSYTHFQLDQKIADLMGDMTDSFLLILYEELDPDGNTIEERIWEQWATLKREEKAAVIHMIKE